MVVDVEVPPCPFCGGKEFVTGRHSFGQIVRATWGRGGGQFFFVEVCLNCGSFIRSYVKDPKTLIPKKGRG